MQSKEPKPSRITGLDEEVDLEDFEHLERLVDEGLEQTFPASDPIAHGRFD